MRKWFLPHKLATTKRIVESSPLGEFSLHSRQGSADRFRPELAEIKRHWIR